MNKLSPSQYTLTPLHVAALQGDVKTMRYLLMTDIRDLDRQDIHGWTPLHHAALTSGACVNALLKAGADSTIQNDMKGTPIDLCRMANAPEFAKEATISTTDATLSAEEFKLQTGATWVNDIYISRMRQRELWSDPEKPKGLSKFNPAKNSPPHLVLKKDPGLEW
ncbi:MAG: ankyrin repeat domain-containing protein, partial [Chlamydiia bacterium]|nr:ankyrin repeat domain-containing protein [Chlamydiia bacterium]